MYAQQAHLPRRVAAAAAFLVAVSSLIILTPAPALAAPDLSVTGSAPAKVLFGDVASHSIEACNPTGPSAFNLSFRAVIADNGIYAGGGDAPTEVIPNAPVFGSTTLLWDNVSDIPTGACVGVSFDVAHQTGLLAFDVGDAYDVDVGAYTNIDPRYVPKFDALGNPISGVTSYTGSGTGSTSTEITAITVRKAEPNTEQELLRGVHDHQTTYTVTVQNNYVNPTAGVIVVDLLPAGLEFLGCGGDNTQDAPTNPNAPIGPPDEEYPGAGALNSAGALVPCTAPDLVETVTQAGDVYTRVTWNNGGAGFAMAATDTLTFPYLAGIPIRENTTTWSGATPLLTGAQGANLDNNNGPETAERDADELALTNMASGSGTYTRNDAATVAVSDAGSYTVTAEDLSVHKDVLNGTIGQGDIETWVLTIETSEYRAFDDVIVTDELPDGVCPLGLINHDPSDPTGECDPTGDVPTIQVNPLGGPPGTPRDIDYSSVTENTNGTWEVTFDPTATATLVELASVPESTTVIITIPTRTREFYQQSSGNAGAVLANDSWSNSVDIEGTSLVPSIDTDQTAVEQVQDESSVGQSAPLPTIDKLVADPTAFVPGALPTPCPVPPSTVSPVPAPYVDGPVASYGPGDVACWALRVDFPASLDTAGAVITDFIPQGHTYLAASEVVAPGSVPVAAPVVNGGSISWTLGSGGDVDVAQVFLMVFATEVTDPEAATSVDVSGNLMKFQSNNTPGAVAPLRDQADAEWAEAELALTKGVKTINALPVGGNPANTDGGTVVGTDSVVYRVDITNGGDRDATGMTVWDVLPEQISCAAVPAINISAGGVCNAAPPEDRIEWSGLSVLQASSLELNYTVIVPAGISPNEVLNNEAGVRSYESATNTGGVFVYYPASNIDSGVTPNTGQASDTSTISSATFTPVKTRSTTENGTGNADEQATIGEQIDYTITIPLPALVTVGSPEFVDALGSQQTLDFGSIVATLDDPGPGGTDITASADWDVDTSGNTLTISYLAGDYTTDADGTTMTVSFSATVDNEAGNVRGGTITNDATLSWLDQNSNPDSVTTNEVSTEIVEPNLQLAKTETGGVTSVSGGSVLSYRVRLTNPAGPGSVSPAHDVTVVDQLPADFVTPSVISGSGTWDPGTHRITWTGIDVDPGSTVDLTYTLTVDADVPAGTVLPNTAAATASSLPGPVGGERSDAAGIAGYAASDGYTITAVDADIAKSVTPGTATIGEQVQFTIDVTIPADTVMWDVRVTDLIPDGMVFDSTDSVTCTACAPAVGAVQLTTVDNGDGSTSVGWWIGDVTTSVADRTLTIVYNAHVANVYNDTSLVLDTDDLDNSALLGWNRTDTVLVDPGSFVDLTATADSDGAVTATLGVIEPALTIDKTVDGADAADAQPGDAFTYTITVTNTGSAPAYDITIEDAPDVELINVVPVGGAADVTDPWTAIDPDIIWFHAAAIPPSGTLIYTYTAELAAPGLLNPTDEAENMAGVSSFYGRPATERFLNPTIDYRAYSGPTDSVIVDLHFPEATLAKTAVGPTPAAVGTPFEWSIVVTNTSTVADIGSISVTDVLPPNWAYDAGSAELNGLGVVDPAITADPGGDTLVWSGLAGLAPAAVATLTFTASPAAAAQVDPGLGVDHTNAAGAALTDASGASGNAAGAYLTNSDTAVAQLAVGSLGDTVWFDADDNGLFDGVDIPLGGIDLDLIWAGPDGNLGTAGDNVTYATTTAADGSYGFANLPEGPFELTVDPATLPLGMTPSFDLDGGTGSPDGVWSGTVGSGVDKTDVDFGYTGTGSLGDEIWYDADQDGTINGAEVPLPGVDVDVVWAGPDGDLLTAADNVPYTATTNGAGIYSLQKLPAGPYLVTVDGATLPTGLTPTYDRDGGTLAPNGVWDGSLGAGEDRDDVDFGYVGIGSIGDVVWHDIDKNGNQDPGEIGLPGVTVTLEWGGPDGNLATVADNITSTTVTASNGTYGFADLADGPHRVTISTATLPPGMAPVYDLDGGLDSTTDVNLNTTTGRDRSDVDFGYSGTGSIGSRLWFDADFNASEDPGEIGLPGVTVNLEWGGPDGNLATAADNVSYSTVTAADGTYGFAELPAGPYEVTVDTGTLPAGLVETYDLDTTATPSAWSGTLAAGENNADVDFGYTGTGSIGDAVWFDRDANGTFDLDEVGIGGVTVDITWAGPDNNLATPADNVVYSAVTVADGTYAVGYLPAGTYRTDVNVATLPAGMSPTFDLDGPGTPSTWTGSLAAAQDKDDVDFGYRGSGSLGDRVWFDRDGDFSVNGDEVGLEDVDLIVTWLGRNGVVGGGDDAAVVVSTGMFGDWFVDGLPPGNYTVAVDPTSLPIGMMPTDDLDGVVSPSLWTGSLGDGEAKSDVDFGYNGSGSIGDFVWIDTNADGVQDAGEAGVVGATVELIWPGEDGVLGTGDEETFTTTTDAAGAYDFDGLPPGDYQVTVVGALPASAPNTFDPDGNGDSTTVVMLSDGELHDTADFGYGGSASIGDRVWWDLNGDSFQDPGEPGLVGIEVTLVGTNPDSSTFTIVTTTDTDGAYLFDGLTDADYVVSITDGLPGGITQTFDDTAPLDNSSAVPGLTSGTAYLAADFGYSGSASIGDRVWNDLNGDGIEDPGEPGMVGVDVVLTWDGPDGLPGTQDDVILRTTTGADGAYIFSNLPAGTFEVALDPATIPGGLSVSADGNGPVDGSATYTLTGGEAIADADVGLVGAGSLGDAVWFDLNGDGVLDAGEPPLEGVIVNLTLPGADGVVGGADDVTISTTTSATGSYLFTGLYDGEYVVTIDPGSLPADMTASYDLDSGTTGPDGVWQGTLDTSAGAQLDVDFGYRGGGAIGDFLWLDLNGDGVQDTGEPGLPGVSVELTWPGEDGISGNADDTVIAAITDADGFYLFPGLPAGTYPVAVPAPPSDLAFTWDEDLTADGATTVVLASGGSHLTADFGLNGTASIGDSVWFDLDGNGSQDAGEPGLPAIDVTITWLGADGVPGGGDDVVIPAVTTDASGVYVVPGLPAGAYVVDISGGLPAGFVPTFDEDGTPDASASVPVIASGETHTTADFGFTGSGAIVSTVWLDLDGDGVQDPGEPGFPAVDVTAVWAGGDGIPGNGDDVTFTTVTGPDGSYAFANLPAGSFEVTIDDTDLPNGLAATYDFDGGADDTAVVTVGIGETSTEPAFGYAGGSSVGDTVWYDVDGDEAQGPSEPGVSGITITLTHFGTDGTAGTGDDLTITSVTGPTGGYLVTGLPAGGYRAAMDAAGLPSGIVPGSDLDAGDPTSTSGILSGVDSLLDVDFGVVGTSALSGAVLVDIDGDGTPEPGDGGIADVTVTVTWDGPEGPVVVTTVTDADGAWSVPGLPPGDYVVDIDASTLPPGYALTTPGSVDVTLAAGGSATVTTGAVALAEISGTLWVDIDGDGIQDPGEAAVVGVTIELLDASGAVIGSVVSGPNGEYTFPDLLPGTYTLRIDPATIPSGIVLVGDASVVVVVDGTTGNTVLGIAFAEAPATLPNTGFMFLTLATMGLLLLAAGSLVLAAVRRRDEYGGV